MFSLCERADEIVDNFFWFARYQRFLVESIEHNPCISVARQQTAYSRERITYHRDEAPLALADAVNDDIGRNKQQVAGKEFYLAVVEIQAQIAVQTEEHHQEIDLDAFFFGREIAAGVDATYIILVVLKLNCRLLLQSLAADNLLVCCSSFFYCRAKFNKKRRNYITYFSTIILPYTAILSKKAFFKSFLGEKRRKWGKIYVPLKRLFSYSNLSPYYI